MQVMLLLQKTFTFHNNSSVQPVNLQPVRLDYVNIPNVQVGNVDIVERSFF